MRLGRLKAPADQPVAYYHCISRAVERQPHFDELDREQFVNYLRLYERFCGVRVLTYCILANHFHLLVAVPGRPEVLPPDAELFERLRGLYGPQRTQQLQEQLGQLPAEQAQAWRQRRWAQMGDISQFMKRLKQRFSQWYNGRHERKGTLWEERFKSVLVEGAGRVLATMAAYIDLNAVRAGVVEDPGEYRWSGYGEAVAGRVESRAGYGEVLRGHGGEAGDWGRVLAEYRVWLYGQGEVEGRNGPGETTVRRGIDPERVRQVVAAKGQMTVSEYVRCRVRYFVDGVVLGSREYVNGVFGAHRNRFGPKRKEGARRLRYMAGEPLFCFRDLRVNLMGS